MTRTGAGLQGVPPSLGIQRQLALTVYSAVLLAALAICAALYLFSQRRSYQSAVSRSEAMVQAASMAFSRALALDDEVLLDAYVHELESRKELGIREIHVLRPDGRVVAHSRVQEYGETYPVPALLRQKQPARLSKVTPLSGETFQVISLLQAKGDSIGALVATFSTHHLAAQLRSEIAWIASATVPILLLTGLGITIYGGRMTRRLKRLQLKARDVGHGEWGEPLLVTGRDEIGQLTQDFNQMMADLQASRARERQSAETIAALNRDLQAQLERIQQLKEQLAEENRALRQQLGGLRSPDNIIGSDASLRPLIEQARQLASLPVTVLITGESGTGKELFARYLHESGTRRNGPFISVNCAALPVTLVESELFGYEKGAFTGALTQRRGKFELAHEGTLFLDEVGELSPEVQAKLLRALQQGEICRLGSDRPITVDVRVVAATNRNLEQDIAQAKFRQDLYYRLKVVELHCPPLRERCEDIPALAQYFIEHYSRKLGKPVVGISPSALRRLMAHGWPGNVRELENMVARAVALAATQVLGPEDFLFLEVPKVSSAPVPAERDPEKPFERLLALCALSQQEFKHNGWKKLLGACERLCLEAVLQQCRNQKEAAERLGLTPTKLHRLIRKHGLKPQNGAATQQK